MMGVQLLAGAPVRGSLKAGRRHRLRRTPAQWVVW